MKLKRIKDAILGGGEEQQHEESDRVWRATKAAGRIGWRYRRQLAPLVLLVGVAWIGWAASVAGFVVVVGGALAAGVSLFRLRGRLPERLEWQYALACHGATVVWLLGCAALGWSSVVLVPGVLAWAGASIAWWSRHPLVGRPAPGAPAATPDPAAPTDDVAPVLDVYQERWEQHLARSGQAFAGTIIGPAVPTKHGQQHLIQGVPGKHHLGSFQASLPIIASGLRTTLTKLVLEAAPPSGDDDEDSSQVLLTVVHRSPIKDPVLYRGPRIADGRVLLGPFADGEGDMSWRLWTKDSAWGGFVLGGTGAGKSRLLELLALAIRHVGGTVIYLDGQDGASSPLLWERATWRGGPAEAKEILSALERGKAQRQRYNKLVSKAAGFHPGGELRLVAVFVDECHQIFTPETGERWAAIAREGRKIGLGVIAASQYSGLPTFGGFEPLRSSLLDGNALAMRTNSRTSAQLVPGLDLDPAQFPDMPGYGYYIAPAGAGRTAPGRVEWIPDDDDIAEHKLAVPSVREWFERIPDQGLDDLTAKSFGAPYLERELRAAAKDAIDLELLQNGGILPQPAGEPARDEAAEDAASRGVADRIIALDWQRYGEMEKAQIITELAATGGVKASTVTAALTRLVDDGTLERPRHGVYRLTGAGRAAA